MKIYTVSGKTFISEGDVVDYLYEEYRDKYTDADSFCELFDRAVTVEDLK